MRNKGEIMKTNFSFITFSFSFGLFGIRRKEERRS